MKERVTLKREDQKKTLADQAYKQIEEAIVTLQLAPGSIVSETELVELIGIGRTPTREAIQRLARDRLIRVLPKRGLLVAPLDLMGQMKLLEVRRQVEGLIIRLATKRASDEHRRAFAQLDAEFREIAFANDGLGFVRCDREFNELCITAAQNEYVEDAMRPLMGLSRRFWLFHHQQCGTDLPPLALLHADTAAAMAIGDEEGGQRVFEELLENVESSARISLAMNFSAT